MRQIEVAEAAAQRRQWFGTNDQRVYVGPDASGVALFEQDTVVWGGKVWRLESEQLRWVVNGDLTVPLISVGTMHVVRA